MNDTYTYASHTYPYIAYTHTHIHTHTIHCTSHTPTHVCCRCEVSGVTPVTQFLQATKLSDKSPHSSQGETPAVDETATTTGSHPGTYLPTALPSYHHQHE